MSARPLWFDLFSGAQPDVKLDFRVVRKGGRPLLLLPFNRRCAARAVDLYPAQKARARLAKSVLRAAIRLALPWPWETASLAVQSAAPLPRWLSEIAGTSAVPPLALLAGNAAARGQRCVLLILTPAGNPITVAKVGIGVDARYLIAREAAFIGSIPSGTPAIPHVRSTLSSEEVEAFAMDYLPGETPDAGGSEAALKVVGAWLSSDPGIPISAIPAWSRLASTCGGNPVFTSLASRMAESSPVPALMHGDFAPWNVRVFQNRWTALDWERGELVGMPAWDWFHFLVQPALLVERAAVSPVAARIEKHLAGGEFIAYARRANVQGMTRELFLAYLLHAVEVLRPTEGLDALKSLLAFLFDRWNVR